MRQRQSKHTTFKNHFFHSSRWLVLLLTCSVCLGCFDSREEARLAVEAGKQELPNNPQKALIHFNRAILHDSRYAEAFAARAAVFQQLQQPEFALSDWREAVRQKPDSAEYRYGLAWQYSYLDQPREAEQALQVETLPDELSAEWLGLQGRIQRQLGSLKDAVTLLNASLQYNKERAETWLELGRCQLLQRDSPAARDFFTEAIRWANTKEEPLLFAAHLALAQVLMNEKKWEEAERELTLAQKFNPLDVEMLRRWAETKFARGDFDAALQYWQQVFSLRAPTAADWYGLAEVHRGKSQTEEAARAIQQAITLNPEEAKYYLFRGRLALQQQAWQQAILDFSQAIELGMNSAEVYFDRGTAWEALGETEQAQQDFAQAANP
ncbi:Hypothetical protein PBC10988_26830 [Planctomycetales bacterium 10988]|nr:Hypothetical protein PBC10988_26830 [Planctomycetales bacterium 10988]